MTWVSLGKSLPFSASGSSAGKKGITIAVISLGPEEGRGTETVTAFYKWNKC